jgi:hypothetical protein
MKPCKLMSVIVIVTFLLCGISSVSADDLVWRTSKEVAVSTARSQGKYILLLAGREICGNCNYMRYTVCESVSPAVRDLIEESFVPWFCDVDASTEWGIYSYGLGNFTLPLICVIDPNDPDKYLDRTTAIQGVEEFHTRLLQYPPLDTDGDEIPDSLEETGCTDSSDADTDDDGIPDGVEDADKDGIVDADETDPCNPDTDGDGLQDGTELGYTLDDIGADTDADFFMPDSDPAATTDPLNDDTDNDGLMDGEEDLNLNGRMDTGESDPNDSSSGPTSPSGFNHIAYLTANPDLPSVWGKAECIMHYINFGFAEKRATCLNLDEYLNANPDLPAGWTYEQALTHYNVFGKSEGRLLAFSAVEYLSLYADLPQGWTYDQAYAHYVYFGKREGRIPSFDEAAYLELYSDLPQSWGQTEAFYHYRLYGINEGRAYDPYDEDVFLTE